MEKAAQSGRLLGLSVLTSGEGKRERQGTRAQGRSETERPVDEGHHISSC